MNQKGAGIRQYAGEVARHRSGVTGDSADWTVSGLACRLQDYRALRDMASLRRVDLEYKCKY